MSKVVITSHPTSEGVGFSLPLQLRQTIKDMMGLNAPEMAHALN